MIQFEPAREVQQALKGEKTSPISTPEVQTPTPPNTPETPVAKPPLAMSLAQKPKLAGIFKDAAPGNAETATTAAQPESTGTTTASEPGMPETAASPATSNTTEVTSAESPQNPVMPHDPTDPHGVHDTAHPDDPEPKEEQKPAAEVSLSASQPEPPATPAEPVIPQEEETEETQSATPNAEAPAAPAAVPPAETTSETTQVGDKMPGEEDFRKRLTETLAALDQEIANAEQEEARFLSDAAKATALVKNKKAERKQLEALQNLDPAMLQSVFKVMQGSDEKKPA